MILFDISLFFLDSLNPVTVAEVIAAVFLAERVAAGGGLGCSTSSGRRVAPTPVRRRPAPQVLVSSGIQESKGCCCGFHWKRQQFAQRT